MSDRTTNTLDLPTILVPNVEEAEIVHDELSVGMDETEFRDAVNSQLQRAKEWNDKVQLEKRQEQNLKYWLGDQVNKDALRDDLEKGVENVILRNLETFIPMATARTPEVGVTPSYKNERTRSYAGNMRRSLQAEWEVYQNMQQLLSRGIRNHAMNLVAVYKMGYDFDENRPYTEEIIATDFVISKDARFVGHYVKDKTLGDLFDMFPEKEKEILSHFGHTTDKAITKKLRASPVTYLEAWLDSLVGWLLGDVVLGVEKNPHFDYTGAVVPMEDENGNPVFDEYGMPVTNKVLFNHFKKPRKPLLFLQYLNRGVHVFDDTTLLEQSIGLQDWINKRKRQIGMNADSTNGHWVGSGDFISQEEFSKIEGGIDEKIWLHTGIPEQGIMKVTGQAMPDYVYSDLLDSRESANKMMGVDNVTLGAKSNNKTATQDVMQRDQNYGRADGYVRDTIEKFAQSWYEWMYHLYLVYTTDDRSIAIPDDYDFENENVCFSRDKVPLIEMKNGDVVPVPIILRVKAGSTLPEDEVATYQKAVQMKDILRPRDFFKMMNMPNPRELEKNFLMWKIDPMADYQDDPQIKAALQRKAQMEQQAMQQQQEQQKMQGEQQFAQQAKLEEMKQKGAMDKEKMKMALPSGDKAPVQENADTSEQGVANALRTEMEEAGLDARQFIQA